MKRLLLTAALCSPVAAFSQSEGRLFLVGAEPANADLSFVELTWLLDPQSIAPGLTGVLERDPRLPDVLL